jgi:hypothetical protein
MPLQVLGDRIAGCAPQDFDRNLAKTVTVE